MICIVTVFGSNNYGSFLQALSLYSVVKKYEKTCFLDFGQRRYHPFITILGAIVKGKSIAFIKRLWTNYKVWSSLPTISIKTARKRRDIIYVIGSDEIWNCMREEMNYPEFWGINLEGMIISYAPTLNNTTLQQLINFQYTNGLTKFKAISVRDNYSKEIIKQIVPFPITVTLDPTLLLERDFFLKNDYKPLRMPYIAIYTFFDEKILQEIKNIIRFAKENGLKLVSIGQEKEWCDFSVYSNCFNPFLYYIDAKYVFTNTFHGTAFAINFETQFVTVPHKSRKILELISEMGLESRDISKVNYNTMSQTIKQGVDYDTVMNKMNVHRKMSINFLKRNLYK